ncbi:serine/threonine-protein phosphatase 4 regulatory subunit 2 [Tribolium madens]|uniref:serine/threonine-protein phosphatase 4 regulatory subunit 2 n=1 Tax=Tribolium madens TaxID=41895 RepID=UPI001CF747C5|nr:serine/threonine-protein phosphatase 4 regulatory subunit 2 [Tribolium madens]
MENPEEILHSLEEFSKTKPKDIPRELEEYLCFVAKTGDPVYQWSSIKSLFREKMINVITEFYETCPSVEIPPCPNVDIFNYDVMKNFILEKLDTFAAAPFTLQRICELLTTPRKEYNRIDKYMRALEKNILVVSTTEPGGRRSTENGEGIMNGLESEHLPETSNSSNDINVEEMDDAPAWPRLLQNENVSYQNENSNSNDIQSPQIVQETVVTASKLPDVACSSSQDTVITCRSSEEPYVSIEPVPSNTCTRSDNPDETDVSVTITAIPAGVQKRRNSVEPVVSSETEEITESCDQSDKTSEPPKESEIKQEETSSSQQIEDADSSSSAEDDKESIESKDEKILDDATPHELSSTETDQTTNEDEVGTSQEKLDEKPDGSEEITVDTTKCSNTSPTPHEETKEDLEITSSDKIDEVHSSQSEAEAKIEVIEKHEESQNVASEGAKEVSEEAATLMDVDEFSEKVEEVVRAEATSDSPL